LPRDFQTFVDPSMRGRRITAGEFQTRPGAESGEHEINDSALGAEFIGVVEQCLRFVELAAFVEKLSQQRSGELRDVSWASGRRQRNSYCMSQVGFGACHVELLVRGKRRETISVAHAQRAGNPLMVLASPPLPAKCVVEVQRSKRPK
jgi:hypothetical protein